MTVLCAAVQGEEVEALKLPGTLASLSVADLAALIARTRAHVALEYAEKLLQFEVDPLELATALERIGNGAAVNADDVDDPIRSAFENLMRGLGLRREQRDDLDGDFGFHGNCKDAVHELAKTLRGSLKRVSGPTLRPPVEDDDDDDDDFGPSEDLELEAAKQKRGRPPPIVSKAPSNPWTDTPGGTSSREEWMMVPPSELDFAKKNRLIPVAKSKFSGSGGPSSSSSSSRKERIPDEARAALDAAVRDQRGPSLLELHQQKQQQKDGVSSSKKKRKKPTWSREDDLLGPAELDAQGKKDLIKNAGTLNDRFTSSIQTSFT